MELMSILILGVLGLFGWIVLQRVKLYRKMAPGPYGIPILGSLLPKLKKDAVKEFQKYKREYGKVFSLSAGDFYVTVVTDYKLIINYLKKDELQGRPDFHFWEIRNGGGGSKNRGILFCDGPTWQEQRRFALRSLRNFGFGKESMEGMLIEELSELRARLKKEVGHPMSLEGVFNASVLNSLWSILTGKRFEPSDPTLAMVINMLIKNLKNWSIFLPGLFLSRAIKLLFLALKPFRSSTKFLDEMRNLLDSVIDEHFETYQPGQVRDFVDEYIQQIKESSAGSSFYEEEGRKNLQIVLLDLFVAGAETTSTTLLWAFLYMCHNPIVQKKVQDELDAVVGRSRPPNRSDKTSMVYLEAVLNEVHRMASLVPFNVYHKAHQDTEIGGYFVPKDSVVLFSIYEAHHDPDVWGDPEVFRPERFLDESGTKLVRHEALMPFSAGKRQCLGETLARDTLFIFFAGLLQSFTFEIDPTSSSTSDLRGTPTFVSSPKPYKVILKERT